MTTQSYKFGTGVLILGEGDDVRSIQAQMTKCSAQAKENVETIDAIPLLDGTEIAEEEEVTYDWTLSGSLLQDLSLAGIIDWSWEHKGEYVPFIFVPHIAIERGVKGTVRVAPITIGGEVTKPKNRPQSDFEWAGKKGEDFIYGVWSDGADDSDPVDDTVTEDV